MIRISIITSLLLIMTNCDRETSEQTVCDPQLINRGSTLSALTLSLPSEVVTGLMKEPTSEGALGRNKEGYFHVRFQMDIVSLAAFAIKYQNQQALEKLVLAMEYSFRYQLTPGDFELVVPPSLQSMPPATEGDKCSGVAFFASALGSSLMMLKQSEWYNNLPSNSLKDRLNLLTEKFSKTLHYLIANKLLLQSYDRDAPNRLLFDALAFYSLGTYLGDASAIQTGVDFIERALQKQDAEGFLKEGDGFDSSYNGVSLKLGLMLLGIVSNSDPIYNKLQLAMSCCAQWQANRVKSSGEISTEGNSRVYSGGETFLGEEKQVAWVDTLLSFYYVYHLSNRASYLTLASDITNYYR